MGTNCGDTSHLSLPSTNISQLRKSAEPPVASNPRKQKRPQWEQADPLSTEQEPRGGARAAGKAAPTTAPAALLQQRRAATREGEAQTGPRGFAALFRPQAGTLRSGSSGMWSNLGGGWQARHTWTETAVHRRGSKGLHQSSSSLQHHLSPEQHTVQEQKAVTVASPVQVPVCPQLLQPHHQPLRQMAVPSLPHSTQNNT